LQGIYKYYIKGENDMDIDGFRKGYLTMAEMLDAFRIFPRLLVLGYTFILYDTITWYMDLKPMLIDNCDVELLGQTCIALAPSTQHAALVTAVVGVAAAIFGLYANSGRKWNGFTPWSKKKEEPTDSA